MEPSVDATLSYVLAKVNPDKAPSIHRNYDYPRQICFGVHMALHRPAHLSSALPRSFSASAAGRRPSPLTYTRLPLAAFTSSARSLSASPRPSGVHLEPAEFFLGCGYIAVIFTWDHRPRREPILAPVFRQPRGFIAATQFPLLIALGMKNNVITCQRYLLEVRDMPETHKGFPSPDGISWDKLNLLHRVVARVLCVLLWIHAGDASVFNIITHVFARLTFSHLVETKGFSPDLFLAAKPRTLETSARRGSAGRGYEMFLVAHFFVALILLVGSYIHTKSQMASQYVWPSFVAWGLDRLLRLLRIFLANGGYRHLLNLFRFGLKTKNTAEALEAHIDPISPRLLRVRVRLPDRFSWTPGQIVYLSIPAVSRTPWEAHPFTIATIDSSALAPSRSEDTSGTSSRDEKRDSSVEEAKAETLVLPMVTPGYSKELMFLIRVRGGFTKRLLDATSSAPPDDTGGSTGKTFAAYVDGPYCSPPSMKGVGTVLLFAGGSGVSFTLPLLLDLIRYAFICPPRPSPLGSNADLGYLGSGSGCKTQTNPACGRVMFVWAIREADQIDAIAAVLCKALEGLDAQALGLDIRIYVTASVEDTDGDAASAGRMSRKRGTAQGIHLLEGRPDVDQIVRAEVEAAAGAMSVNVCGTQGLAKHVRKALRGVTSQVRVSLKLPPRRRRQHQSIPLAPALVVRQEAGETSGSMDTTSFKPKLSLSNIRQRSNPHRGIQVNVGGRFLHNPFNEAPNMSLPPNTARTDRHP
ncbi:hypothetical protein B0H13DRAFT_2558715 [Mycena leptocephala]|nr:hypothetical protein B0H13DRAFT_2558715 [Mycena leptocephala]